MRADLEAHHLLSYTYEDNEGFCQGYPFCKSFRRDILGGYLDNTAFVFIDLAGKCKFWSIYPI